MSWKYAQWRLLSRLEGARSREGGPLTILCVLSGQCVFYTSSVVLAYTVEGTSSLWTLFYFLCVKLLVEK